MTRRGKVYDEAKAIVDARFAAIPELTWPKLDTSGMSPAEAGLAMANDSIQYLAAFVRNYEQALGLES